MKEFTVGGNVYSATPLDAFSQLHIGLKIAPLIAAMAEGDGSSASIMRAIGAASYSDVMFVLEHALPSVKRKSGQVWANLYNVDAHRLAFEDVSGIELLEIATYAIGEYVRPFFVGLVKLVSGTQPASTD